MPSLATRGGRGRGLCPALPEPPPLLPDVWPALPGLRGDALHKEMGCILYT